MKREARREPHQPQPRRLVPGVHTVIPSTGNQGPRSGSWWLSLDRAAFTARAQEEATRLRRGPFSSNKPTPTR
jgi:uncharacterized SAM-binding protein YcdF (DUF218 family)